MLFEVSEQVLADAEAFICTLYGKPNFNDINELRYHFFCTRPGNTSQLPPCHDALKCHIMWATYQAAIWCRALETKPQVPSPDGHGWKMKDGTLAIHWMDQLPAPRALLELISCGCKTGCTTRRCSCRANDMLCTDACLCSKCDNVRGDDEDDAQLTDARNDNDCNASSDDES